MSVGAMEKARRFVTSQPSCFFFFSFATNLATIIASSCRGNEVHKGYEDHKHWAFAGIIVAIFFFVFF
jgi:hypothetical protein